MVHKIGTYHLQCQNCKSTKAIDVDTTPKLKYPLNVYINQDLVNPAKKIVDCIGCGADIEFTETQIAKKCPYCKSPLVVKPQNKIEPSKIIPFYIDVKKGREIFKNWLGSLWFAPNDLKKLIDYENRFTPTYLPYFSFDCKTSTYYTGQRGDIYYVQVTKRVYFDGKEQYITEMEPRIRWSFVSNQISRDFRDILIDSKSEIPNIVKSLNRYDLNRLVNFNPSFMSGYEGFEYDSSLSKCYKSAKDYMSSVIYQDVLWDIGGDEQRVESIDTKFFDEEFDIYMLPVWISSFKYKGKKYVVAINGQTGEIVGNRPYSYVKIFLLIIVIAIIVGIFFYYTQGGTFETNFSQKQYIPATQNY